VSLTDELALALLADCGPPEVDVRTFVRFLHACDFIVERNSEWHFAPDVRRWQVTRLLEQPALLASRHSIVRSFAASHDVVSAGSTTPSYLFTPAGRAYHEVYYDLERGIGLYAEAARSAFSGYQWLAGMLAEEQQELGVLPKGVVEPSFLRGMALYQEENPSAAEPYLKRVAESSELRQEVAIALHLLGVIHTRRRRFESALGYLNRAVELHERLEDRRGLAMVLNSRGSLKRDMHDIEGALVDLDRAVWLAERIGDHRSLAMILNSRGGVKRDRGDLEGALRDLDRAVSLNDGSTRDQRSLAMILNTRGGVRRDRGDLAGAQEDLDLAVTLSEQSRDRRSLLMLLNSRGGVKRDRGDVRGAFDDLDRAIALSESVGDVRLRSSILNSRSVVRRDAGDLEGAAADVEEIRATHPNVLKEAGMSVPALKASAKGIRKLLRRLADITSSTERNQILARYYFELAKGTLVHAKDPIRPIWLLQRVIELGVDGELRGAALFTLGRCYFEIGEHHRAAEYFKAGLSAGFQGSEIYARLAYSLMLGGHRLDETRAYFEAAIGDPDNVWARSWYALALSAEGHHEQAEALAESALQLPGQETNSVLLCNLATVLIASGDAGKRDKAIAVLRTAELHAHPGFDRAKRMLADLGLT
jgi:tetratricopeptide (TPR) repeat protein